MITRRRLLLFGLLAGVAVAVPLLWLGTRPGTRITRENFEKIQVGITMEEVETILGGPARREETGPLEADDGDFLDVDPGSGRSHDELEHLVRRMRMEIFQGAAFRGNPPPAVWSSNSLMIKVIVTSDNRVDWCEALAVQLAPEPPLDKLRRWLGL